MLEVNRLHLLDCMEGMARFPDGWFDLAIVDPPYGINISNNIGRRTGDKKSRYAPIRWDSQPPSLVYFAELRRVARNLVIWGANHFIERIGATASQWIVWDKKFSEDVSFSSFELAYTTFSGADRMVSIHPDKRERIHPTQKPVALYNWLLKNYAKPGDKILDTHAGSASSLVACHRQGFDFVGFEIDAEYHRLASARLETEMAQPALFEEMRPPSARDGELGFGGEA